MNRPKPKAELVTRRNNDTSFEIFTASADAAEWVKREMPAYGMLYTGIPEDRLFIMTVAPTFDVGDVIQYAESYNEQAVEKERSEE